MESLIQVPQLIVPPPPPVQAEDKPKPKLIGIQGLKEYYLMPDGSIQWRVPDIRESVRAEPGWLIASSDFSQIEVKIMALLSGDPFFYEAINSGKDMHCYMLSEIFEIPYDLVLEAYKAEKHPRHDEIFTLRSNVKTTTFGIPYGASAARIALMTGKTVDEAQELIDRYFKKAWRLKQWLDWLREKAVKDRCSRSPRGRVRWYVVPERRDPNYRKTIAQIERFAGNMPIQAGCVDLLKPALAKFYLDLRDGKVNGKPRYNARLLLVVHDEIVITGEAKCIGRREHWKELSEALEKKTITVEQWREECQKHHPVPLILRDCMDWAYNQMEVTRRVEDPDTGTWRTEKAKLSGLQNKVDVAIGEYWVKE